MQRNNPFSSGSVLAALVLSAMTATGAGSVELSADRHLSQPTANISQAKLARDQARVTAEKAPHRQPAWLPAAGPHSAAWPAHGAQGAQRGPPPPRHPGRPVMDFDTAFDLLMGHEGAYQCDPDDKGNWTGGQCGRGALLGTKWGISAASYPGEDIANLPRERAALLARRDFWGPAGCDVVPDALRFDLFDTGYHSGPTTAVKLLQRACGEVPDGLLGARTLLAISAMNPLRLLARFNGHRLDHLNDNPRLWALYGRGWAQRIADNLKRA